MCETLCRKLSNFDCLKFVFRPELRFGAVGDFNASAKEVPGRGTLLVLMLVLVLVLGGGELGSVAWLDAFDLASRGGVTLRSGRLEGVITVGDDSAIVNQQLYVCMYVLMYDYIYVLFICRG